MLIIKQKENGIFAMNIAIYEDQNKDRTLLVSMINQLKNQHKIGGSLYATGAASEIENYLLFTDLPTLFLLDIVEKGENVGFALCDRILEHSQDHVVVFITGYVERILSNAKKKIQSLFFISKKSGNLKDQLEQLLLYTAKRFSAAYYYTVPGRNIILKLPYDSIFYYEKMERSHRVKVVHKQGYCIFNSTLKSVKEELSGVVVQCHKSFLVRPESAIGRNKLKQMILFDGGEQCMYSIFYLKQSRKLQNIGATQVTPREQC